MVIKDNKPNHAPERPIFEEDATQKTTRKIRENPMVPIGMAGFFGAVFYGVRHFRSRPKHVSASMYIMQFRVFAQSIAVGCMGLGIGYTIFKDKIMGGKDNSHPKDNHNHSEGHHHGNLNLEHHSLPKDKKPHH